MVDRQGMLLSLRTQQKQAHVQTSPTRKSEEPIQLYEEIFSSGFLTEHLHNWQLPMPCDLAVSCFQGRLGFLDFKPSTPTL